MPMNLSSSFLNGVFDALAVAARLAIYPIIVSSPVLMIMPVQSPASQIVPKNARLSVSKAFFSAVHSLVLNNNFDSPVKELLLTFISCDSIILRSAGILFPLSIFTISPGTKVLD